MTNRYGRPPGDAKAPRNHARLSIPGGITLTAISGGAIDLNDMGASDSQDTLTIDSVAVITAPIAFTTDLATTARLLAANVNANVANHNYWASIKIGATDWVEFWLRDGTATSGALTVTGTDTGYTPNYVNMNTEQAFVAAVRAPSGNYGIDMFDTKMYQVGFDFSLLRSLDSNWDITTAKGVELHVYPEDQILNAHIGPEGLIACRSAEWTILDIMGCMEGHQRLFLQSAAAQNCWYKLLIY